MNPPADCCRVSTNGSLFLAFSLHSQQIAGIKISANIEAGYSFLTFFLHF